MVQNRTWTFRLTALLLSLSALFSLAACGAANELDTPAEPDYVIVTEADSFTVMETDHFKIGATVSGTEEKISLSYTSRNPEIATVSKYGKVLGVAPGTTEIVITAPNGQEKVITVTVEKYVVEKVLRVALNVLYNDTTLSCTNNETGEPIEIRGDGQYTVSFDCSNNLSDSAKTMGVTALRNLTAIFLYDQDVRDGTLKTSNVVSCEIRWDKIVVNGQELTITNSEFKSAMKSTGIFDTNDPLNAWDGSSVDEVTVDTENHILNINVENPTTITITFTIRGLTFAE